MSTLIYANNAVSSLAGPISSTATSIVLQAGGGSLFPDPNPGEYFTITMIPASTGVPGEIIWCTARASDVLTVTRGHEGTTQTAYAAGDAVSNQVTAGGIGVNLQAILWPGNPNGSVPGWAGSSGPIPAPPSQVWDTVTNIFWICTVSGNASTAVWVHSTGSSTAPTIVVGGTTFTFTVPTGIFWVRARVTGAGGGGGGSDGSTINGGCGGAGGTVEGIYAVTPGNVIACICGVGGTAGSAGANNGGDGTSSSFGSFSTALGGSGGFAASALFAGGRGQGASGTGVTTTGGDGSDGQAISPFLSLGMGLGGASWYGGGGRAGAAAGGGGEPGRAWGSGGGGGYGGSVSGGPGASGLVVLEYW